MIELEIANICRKIKLFIFLCPICKRYTTTGSYPRRLKGNTQKRMCPVPVLSMASQKQLSQF